MKSKRWIWVTLTILLTLIVLVGVAGAGFHIGMMQSTRLARTANGNAAQFPPFEHMQGFQNNGNNQQGRDPRMMQFGRGGPMRNGFGRGLAGFLAPLFGLVHLILLGGLIWLGFTLFKNSGWQLTRVAQPAPVASNTPSVEQKKE